ncbi:hypothetical protein EXIGLDRAFT_716228 [Exidia glandulosa HHB12029]|uniref:Uncharacterized protein n=1 Tax=Exidia glandulosa HHB12029 TaxID=1314781 RepID=A0A165QY75_EXIGL|nr:hypothetical protein EXIGLDRAFT_716228 [Exidia glandulosa HHB12029]
MDSLDPATIAFQRSLVSSLSAISQPLAALHKARADVLCPLSCPRCGYAPLRTRKTQRRIERSCSRCQTVSYEPLAKRAKHKFHHDTVERPQEPVAPVRNAVSSDSAQPVIASGQSGSKRRKQHGLEKLLAQNRERQAHVATALGDPFGLGQV